MPPRNPVDPHALNSPIAVFDAGLGSYDIVRTLRRHYPESDLIYFADRASFPYGAKSEAQLQKIAVGSSRYLRSLGAGCVVIGSNAPSVTVLAAVAADCDFPVLGVLPPVRQALAAIAPDQGLLLAGAASMTGSPRLHEFIEREAGHAAARVHAVAATALIELVESGKFLTDPETAVDHVADFLGRQLASWPELGGVLLSSTHLPWLSFAFQRAAPGWQLFNPADDVARSAAPYAVPGTGKLLSLVTESPALTVRDFAQTLDRLGIALELQPVPALELR